MLKEIARELVREKVQEIAVVGNSTSADMSAAPESTFVQTVILTILVAFGYKIIHGIIRKYLFKATCVVIGAGPTGLISVIVASRTPYISRILLIEQNSYFNLINKHHQIAIQAENVKFLTSLGINFKKIDGIWQSDTFITMLGTFQEHLLGIIYRLQSKLKVDIRLCTKVSPSSHIRCYEAKAKFQFCLREALASKIAGLSGNDGISSHSKSRGPYGWDLDVIPLLNFN